MRCTTSQLLNQGRGYPGNTIRHARTRPSVHCWQRRHVIKPCPASPRPASWQVLPQGPLPPRSQLPGRRGTKLRETVLTEAPTATDVTATVTAERGDSSSSPPFSWTRHWWPLIPLDYLDPKKPKAMTLLGVKLVVWRDGEGQWRCFKDACPHRLAPLSEGRVESDGTLLCSYHAWRFDGEGKCTTIPQATSKEAEETAKKSRRSCATAFPVQEKVGLLWVWPDEADTRWVDAAAAQPVVSRVQEERYAAAGSLTWFMREMPYGYEVLVENLIDPAHFPVSHHKLHAAFDTRYKLCGVEFNTQKEPESTPWLMANKEPTVAYEFTAGFNMPRLGGVKNVMQFTAPSLISYGDAAGFANSTQLFAVPVGPSQSRAFQCDVVQPRTPPPPASIGEWFQRTVFRLMLSARLKPAIKHRSMLRLFDGDGIFLNMQETNLHRGHQGDWRASYYMPSPCDQGVAAALSWMDKVGRPFALTSDTVQGPIDRRVLLDRFTQHTAHCPTCQNQVKRSDFLLQAAKALAAACFLAACGVVGCVGLSGLAQAGAPFVTQAGAAVGLLLASAVWAVTAWTKQLQARRQEYFFTDYVHADID